MLHRHLNLRGCVGTTALVPPAGQPPHGIIGRAMLPLVAQAAASQWHTPLDNRNHCRRRPSLLAPRPTPSPLFVPRWLTQPPAVPRLRASPCRGHLTGRSPPAGHASSRCCRCRPPVVGAPR
ncbi:hypothetical protein [Oryza sativa Japonica Group]|uniref:Uncharacterized protein n=1 Tax=Oryza sativa subsp. japonica TaxID=39947 RepID=Q5JNG5_ORYSJ|nr:hypothetical protein [Oryza sativa Japonica Group]BAD86993.1 hypothetical protein [Oryza sativa Japonica Group]